MTRISLISTPCFTLLRLQVVSCKDMVSCISTQAGHDPHSDLNSFSYQVAFIQRVHEADKEQAVGPATRLLVFSNSQDSR